MSSFSVLCNLEYKQNLNTFYQFVGHGRCFWSILTLFVPEHRFTLDILHSKCQILLNSHDCNLCPEFWYQHAKLSWVNFACVSFLVINYYFTFNFIPFLVRFLTTLKTTMGAIVKSTIFSIMLVTLMIPYNEAELKISAFNIQIFGVSKMEDQFVVDLLIQVKYRTYSKLISRITNCQK